jgi:hypothetical protein
MSTLLHLPPSGGCLDLQLSTFAAFALHCTENTKQIFPEMKLRGLVPNFCIHVSVSDLYIPTISSYL